MSDAVRLLLLFLVLAVVATGIFIAVALSTRRAIPESEELEHEAHVIRGRWFLGLMLALCAIFVATVPFFPYLTSAEAMLPAERVPVTAAQYVFIMPDHFPLNRRILFEVTSRDVNHDFAIYDPKGHLVAQVQAMPDYVNYLAVTFHQPGQYLVHCLEYCGPGHFVMEKHFTVGGSK